MSDLIDCVLVGLIVDLDLAPRNEMAREFYDVHWQEVLALENSRRDLDNMSWRNSHIHLRKRDPFYVHESDCSDLFATVE